MLEYTNKRKLPRTLSDHVHKGDCCFRISLKETMIEREETRIAIKKKKRERWRKRRKYETEVENKDDNEKVAAIATANTEPIEQHYLICIQFSGNMKKKIYVKMKNIRIRKNRKLRKTCDINWSPLTFSRIIYQNISAAFKPECHSWK